MALPQKQFFLDRKITIKSVAERIGSSRAYVTAVFNQRIQPARPTVFKIDQLIAEIRSQETT